MNSAYKTQVTSNSIYDIPSTELRNDFSQQVTIKALSIGQWINKKSNRKLSEVAKRRKEKGVKSAVICAIVVAGKLPNELNWNTHGTKC